jgi:hypothetical protein
MYSEEKKMSKARYRIHEKHRKVEQAYQSAKENGQPIEVLIDELSEQFNCTRDNVRYIIRMYRRRNNLVGKEVVR